MKTTLKSLMVIGMMILSTATSFAANNADHHNKSQRPQAPTMQRECRLRHMHDSRCGGIVMADRHQFAMDKKMRKHMAKGNHKFDRHGMCKKCRLTRRDIRRFEHSMTARPRPAHPTTYPMVRPRH